MRRSVSRNQKGNLRFFVGRINSRVIEDLGSLPRPFRSRVGGDRDPENFKAVSDLFARGLDLDLPLVAHLKYRGLKSVI